jgi:hypothetical protein
LFPTFRIGQFLIGKKLEDMKKLFFFFCFLLVNILNSKILTKEKNNFITEKDGLRWVNNTREGFTFRVSLAKNDIFHVGEIAKGSAVIFIGTEDSKNWIINLFLPNLTMSNQIKIEAFPNTNGTVYSDFPPPVNTNLRYHFENWLFADPGRSKVSISTLEMYLTNVENWKYKIRSPTVVMLKGTPIGASLVMELEPESTVDIDDIWSSILVLNSIIKPNSKIFNERKSMHFAGQSTKVITNLTEHERVTYLEGCLIATDNSIPIHTSWYISQLEYYGIPVDKALKNCSIYTHTINELEIKAPMTFASEVSKLTNTKFLTIKDGNLNYKDSKLWKNVRLTDSSIDVNEDYKIQLINSHVVRIVNSFEKDSNFEILSDNSINTMHWILNCLESSVMRWNTSKLSGRICPGANNVMPNFKFLNEINFLDLTLSKNLIPLTVSLKNVMRQVTWENTTVFIHDDDLSLFNVEWVKVDQINFMMADLQDWAVNYDASQLITQEFNIYSSNSTVNGLLGVHFQHSDICSFNMTSRSLKIENFYCKDCQVNQISVDYSNKCILEVNKTPYNSEVVVNSGMQSIATINEINNGIILVSTRTNVVKDLSMNSGVLLVTGNNSITNLNFLESRRINMFGGCIFNNQNGSQIKSEWFRSQASDLGIQFNENCSFISSKVEQVEIFANNVTAKDIDMVRDIQYLKITNSDVEYSDSSKCLSLEISPNDFMIPGRLHITISSGRTFTASIDFCESSRMKMTESLFIDSTNYYFNCLETDKPFLKSSSPSLFTTICNRRNNRVIPFVEIVSLNVTKVFYDISELTTSTMNHQLFILDKYMKYNQIHQLKWNKKLELTVSVEEGNANLRVDQRLNQDFPPTLNLKKLSNVTFSLLPEANIQFSSSKLYFNSETNLIETLNSDSNTCLLPQMQCIPQLWVDTQIYERTCLHQNFRKQCNDNIGLIINAPSQIFSCNATSNDTALQFNSITNINKISISFPWWIILIFLLMTFLSLTYPIFHVLDFGQTNILLAGMSEQIDLNLSKWSVEARTIVDVCNMITGNSSGWICYDSYSNYQLLLYLSFIFGFIFILVSTGIYILVKSLKIKHKLFSFEGRTGKPHFVLMLQNDLRGYKKLIEFVIILFSIFIFPSIVYLQGTILFILFLVILGLYVVVSIARSRSTKWTIWFHLYLVGYFLCIVFISYFSLINFGSIEFLRIHFLNLFFSLLRLIPIIQTLIVLINNHRKIFGCNFKDLFNLAQNFQFYVAYVIWFFSFILWFISIIFGGLFISGVTYETFDYFIVWCSLSLASGISQILSKLIILQVKGCVSCKNKIEGVEDEEQQKLVQTKSDDGFNINAQYEDDNQTTELNRVEYEEEDEERTSERLLKPEEENKKKWLMESMKKSGGTASEFEPDYEKKKQSLLDSMSSPRTTVSKEDLDSEKKKKSLNDTISPRTRVSEVDPRLSMIVDDKRKTFQMEAEELNWLDE